MDSQTPRFSILNQMETKVTGELQFCTSLLTPHYFLNQTKCRPKEFLKKWRLIFHIATIFYKKQMYTKGDQKKKL